MPRRKPLPGSNDDLSPWATCPDCASADPQVRSRHQIDLAKLGGLDEVRKHLTKQYVEMRDPEKARPDVVDDVCNWLGNLMTMYSGMADEKTGRPLAWWEMREKMRYKAKQDAGDLPKPPAYQGVVENLARIIQRHIEQAQAENPGSTSQATEFQVLMFELMSRSVNRWQDTNGAWHPKLDLEGRSVQCYEWEKYYATTNPELAEELRYQAKTYGDMNVAEQARQEREKAHA